ncbi:unnamed protein product [Amaranthus hypochondriacus]
MYQSDCNMVSIIIQQDQITLYEDTAKALKSKPIYIELGPTTVLAKTCVLKWVLKSISLKPITVHEPKNKGLLLPNLSSKKSLSIRCESRTIFHFPIWKM